MKTKSINEVVVGRVHYLTIRINFPPDRDEWIRQRPIPGSTPMALFHFIDRRLNIPVEMKQKLCNTLECSWKDKRGVWTQLMIETTRRKERNGSRVNPFAK